MLVITVVYNEGTVQKLQRTEMVPTPVILRPYYSPNANQRFAEKCLQWPLGPW